MLLESAKTSATPLAHAVLIGVSVDVALRLRPAKAGEESAGVSYIGHIKASA